MLGTDLTIAVAVAAGLLSFLSPCVLPLVPAYLGQLTAVAVAGGAGATMTDGLAPTASRWLAVRHAAAFVAGFGLVFILLGVTATYAASGLAGYLPLLRQVGGVILIVLGLNLAGIVRIPALDRTWRPLEAGASGSLAARTGSVALSRPGGLSRRISGSVSGARAEMEAVASGWTANARNGLRARAAIGSAPVVNCTM